MTTLKLTPEVMAAVKRKLAIQARRILEGKPMWTPEEIRQSLSAPIPGVLHDPGGSHRRSEDR